MLRRYDWSLVFFLSGWGVMDMMEQYPLCYSPVLYHFVNSILGESMTFIIIY